MAKHDTEFLIECIFQTSADADERLAEAYDLILTLILEELQNKPPDGQ